MQMQDRQGLHCVHVEEMLLHIVACVGCDGQSCTNADATSTGLNATSNNDVAVAWQ